VDNKMNNEFGWLGEYKTKINELFNESRRLKEEQNRLMEELLEAKNKQIEMLKLIIAIQAINK